MVVVYDHALKDFSSRGYMVVYENGVWSSPAAITPDNGGEIGSGHVANGIGNELAYVYIAKALGPEHEFQARGQWYRDGKMVRGDQLFRWKL